MHCPHVRRSAPGRIEEIDRENDRTPAGLLDGRAHGELFARPHGEKKIRLRPTDRRGVPDGREPCIPPARRLADQFLHRLVGEGQQTRIKDDTGRVGIAEGQGFAGLESLHRSPGVAVCMDIAPNRSLFPDATARQFIPDPMPAAIRPSMPKRRPSGRRRPRLLRSGTLGWLALVCLALAFLAGVGWQRTAADRAKRAAASSGPTPEDQAAARRLLERAVTARHADQPDEALRLAREARQTDPKTPGAAMFIAELALRQGKPDEVDTAAREAIGQGVDVAGVKVVLAVNRWMQRSDTSVADAGAAAAQFLQEASAEELSNGAARFFAGDLQRAVGRPGEAHRSLLGGLHRQEPWHSSALLAAKVRLAGEEAGQSEGAPGVRPPSEYASAFGAAAYDMHRALQGGGTGPAIAAAQAKLRGTFTGRQLEALSRDPAFRSVDLVPAGEGGDIPFAVILPPAEKKETLTLPPP